MPSSSGPKRSPPVPAGGSRPANMDVLYHVKDGRRSDRGRLFRSGIFLILGGALFRFEA
jgi:hypothetical protein